MKKTKVLALVLIFALASLGGAYAAYFYTDEIYVHETIKTGQVNVVWEDAQVGEEDPAYRTASGSYPESSDPSPNYTGVEPQQGIDYSNTPWYNPNVYAGNTDHKNYSNQNDKKNIGSKDVTLVDDTETLPATANPTDIRNQGDVMEITLKTGYPGYQEYITAAITNKSSIPVKFEINPDLGGDPAKNTMARLTSEQAGIKDWFLLKIVDYYDPKKVYYDSKTGSGALEGDKLNPGDSRKVLIYEKILDNAPQLSRLQFRLQLRAIQWNEYDFSLPDAITTPADGIA